MMDRTTLSRNLRPLERDGLIRTASGATDRRVKEITLTAAGHRILSRTYPLWERAQAKLARQLGSERMARLLGELNEATTRLRAA